MVWVMKVSHFIRISALMGLTGMWKGYSKEWELNAQETAEQNQNRLALLEKGNWTQLPVTPLIEGDWVYISDWNSESPWPEIYVGNNRCWEKGIRIFYEDFDVSREFCNITQWECEFVG